MVKTCLSCSEITQNEAALYCEFCGERFPETDTILLRQIYDQIKESQISTERFNLLVCMLTLGTITLAGVALIIGERNFIVQGLSQNATYINQTELYLVVAIFLFIIFLFIMTIVILRSAKKRNVF